MDDTKRLELIAEAVRYCQHVRELGMLPAGYSKALREPVYFLWEAKAGSKARAAKFRSRAAVGLSHGKGELVCDHAVPFRYVQEELLALDPVTADAIRDILERYGTLVLITKAEDALLNSKGLRSKMPANWDGSNPLARYEAVGIELLENPGAGSRDGDTQRDVGDEGRSRTPLKRRGSEPSR